MKTLSTFSMICLIFSLSLIVAPHAEPADWVLVSDGKTTKTYVDKESMVKSKSDDLRKIWMKMEFNDDTKYDYFLDLYEYECSERRYRVIQGKTYLKNGEIIDAVLDPAWRYSTPKTTAETVIGFVCR